jgi:hypothetical protein
MTSQDGKPVPNVPIELTVGRVKQGYKSISGLSAIEQKIPVNLYGNTDITAIVQDNSGLLSCSTAVVNVTMV